MIGSIPRDRFETWANSLGSSSTTFFGVAMWLHLLKTDIDPTLDTIPLDAMLADFDNYAPAAIASAVRATSYDLPTGERLIVIPPATGGNRWETGSLSNLPQTIYAVALSDDSVTIEAAHCLALGRLDSPIELTGDDQEVDIPLLRVRINPAAVDGL